MLFDKIASVYFLLEKYIDIVALEMAGQWNQHCANCIGRFRSVLFFFTAPPKIKLSTTNWTTLRATGGVEMSLTRAKVYSWADPDLQNILRLVYDNVKVTIDLRRTPPILSHDFWR